MSFVIIYSTMKIPVYYFALIAVLVLGTFYWFQWRPSEIRKKCLKISKEVYGQAVDVADEDGDGKIKVSEIERYQKWADRKYDNCLHEEGLK
jgi:hypothetical protein